MTRPRLGRIRCATMVARDAQASARRYAQALDYRIVETGQISAPLAVAWGARHAAGARYVILGPASGADCYVRFVESADVDRYPPYSCYGWNAIELTVRDCDAAAATLADHGFKIVGTPHDLDFSAGALRAAQLQGDCGEVLYLTQIKRPMDGFQLPVAQCAIDRIFIAILTGSSPQVGFADYAERFSNASAGPFETPVPVIAGFQNVDQQHPYQVGTLALAPGYYLEFDDAPAHIAVRPQHDGLLPSGIAMISIEVDGEAAPTTAGESWRPGGNLYGTSTIRRTSGAFGEWIELLYDSSISTGVLA